MKKFLAIVFVLVCNCVAIGQQRPGVLAYETRENGWSYASAGTKDGDIIQCFKLTPQTVVYIEGKKVKEYPAKEQRPNYHIECFVPNEQTGVMRAVSLRTVKQKQTKTKENLKEDDFNMGGKKK